MRAEVPTVEIAGHKDRVGVRRPDAEGDAAGIEHSAHAGVRRTLRPAPTLEKIAKLEG
jgi:hypothetical protein